MFSTYLYNINEQKRPTFARVHAYEKTTIDTQSTYEPKLPLKLPTTPLEDRGLSTSRPRSPIKHHARVGSSKGYFRSNHED